MGLYLGDMIMLKTRFLDEGIDNLHVRAESRRDREVQSDRISIASRLVFSSREKLTSRSSFPGLDFGKSRHAFQNYRAITYLRSARAIWRNWGTSCNESKEQENKSIGRREELHDRIRCADKTCLNGISDQHSCRRSTYFNLFVVRVSEFELINNSSNLIDDLLAT